MICSSLIRKRKEFVELIVIQKSDFITCLKDYENKKKLIQNKIMHNYNE
jgi:hypothetical protein